MGIHLFIPLPGLEPGSSGGKEASEPNRRFTVGFLMFLVRFTVGFLIIFFQNDQKMDRFVEGILPIWEQNGSIRRGNIDHLAPKRIDSSREY